MTTPSRLPAAERPYTLVEVTEVMERLVREQAVAPIIASRILAAVAVTQPAGQSASDPEFDGMKYTADDFADDLTSGLIRKLQSRCGYDGHSWCELSDADATALVGILSRRQSASVEGGE